MKNVWKYSAKNDILILISLSAVRDDSMLSKFYKLLFSVTSSHVLDVMGVSLKDIDKMLYRHR